MNNKLSKVEFAKQMETLKAFYIQWKLDLDNPIVQKLWYSVFENLSDMEFGNLIMDYCMNNVYPPQSPTHLIEHRKSMLLRLHLSGEQAWEVAYSKVREHGFDVQRTADYFTKNGEEEIGQSLLDIRGQFVGLQTDSVVYVRKDFILIYERNLNKKVSQQVMIGYQTDTLKLKVGKGNE